MSVFGAGFLTSFSLILAIGAQNAFVLKQGLMRHHVLPVVLFCSISDAFLICVGVFGSAQIVDQYPGLIPLMRWGGAAFLIVYGLRAALSAYKGGAQLLADGEAGSLWGALATVAALTWLNPHVYLDTVVLIGAISSEFSPHQMQFAFGAVLASGVFFFSLGFGARLLAPVFARPLAWRILDGGIALVMWSIAFGLIFGM